MDSISLPTTEFSSTIALDSSLTQQFKLVVERYPLTTAVSDQYHTLTYQELWDRSLELSFSLVGLPTQSLVSIESGISTNHIVAIWATLLAGHSYIFFPPKGPGQNHDRYSDSIRVDATISFEKTGINVTIRNKEFEFSLLDHNSQAIARHSQSAACVVMTSGSTGEPKFVVFEDQHLVFEAWRQNLDTGLCPEDNMDLLFSLHFSASLACIFPALLTGAALHLLDLAKVGWAMLPEWWQQREITIANLSTSTFRKLISSNQPIFVPKMRMLGAGAEAMNKEDVNGFLTCFPGSCELQQSYASTEARTISHWLLRKHGWDNQSPVPVGYAVTGKRIKILNPDRSVVQEGDVGEIYVESDFIPGSYWEPTRISWHTYLQRSRPSRQGVATGDMGFFSPSGSLVLTGRKDFQIKIRGQKVSPEWVENILKTTLGTSAQVTVAEHAKYGYIGALGPEVSPDDLPRVHTASDSLPGHMRPTRWFQFSEWPTNRNGKFDRNALMRMEGSATTLISEAPLQNKAEIKASVLTVIEIMETVLGLQYISPTADFFDDLGGDSLNAVEVWSAVLERLSVSGPFELMQRLRTAEAIGIWTEEQSGTSAFVMLSEGNKDLPPIICISPIGSAFKCYEPLVSSWKGEQSIMGLLTPFGKGRKDLSLLITESLQSLETTFPTGPITLCGYSYAGVIVVALAKRLLQVGRHVDTILIDTPTYRPTSLWWKLIGYPFTKLTSKRKACQPSPFAAKKSVAIPSLYKQQLHLLRDFSPVMENPAGTTIIFEALITTPSGFHYRRDMNWNKWVSGKIRQYTLLTTHNNIVKAPCIEEISRVIQLLIPANNGVACPLIHQTPEAASN